MANITNGTVTVEVTGGVGPYQYTLLNAGNMLPVPSNAYPTFTNPVNNVASNTFTFGDANDLTGNSGLQAGLYKVKIVDANQCETVSSTLIVSNATPSPTATPVPTATEVPPTATPAPEPTATEVPPTATPEPTTVLPTATPGPTAVEPTATPGPTAVEPTATPEPTAVEPTATPEPTAVEPTATPEPTAVEPTATPEPTAVEPTATPEPTAVEPTATPEPTATEVPPTATPVPPTATPDPTATEVPPTATPVPPTATPVPPTATPEPTATEVPPTPTPEPTAVETTSTPEPTSLVPPTATPEPTGITGLQFHLGIEGYPYAQDLLEGPLYKSDNSVATDFPDLLGDMLANPGAYEPVNTVPSWIPGNTTFTMAASAGANFYWLVIPTSASVPDLTTNAKISIDGAPDDIASAKLDFNFEGNQYTLYKLNTVPTTPSINIEYN